MDAIKEETTYLIRVAFTDEDGDPAVPSSGAYRIDDITDGVITGVKDDTAFTPIGPTHDIEITPAENAILVADHEIETRLVTVSFLYGAARQGRADYRYYIENMKGVA
jgi:hypothetical protein